MDDVRQSPQHDAASIELKLASLKLIGDRIRRWKLAVSGILAALLVGTLIIGSVAYNVLNQSVLIWRVFRANTRICAPFMTPLQLAQLEAQFATMKSREDYLRIRKTQDEIAKHHALTLVDIPLW